MLRFEVIRKCNILWIFVWVTIVITALHWLVLRFYVCLYCSCSSAIASIFKYVLCSLIVSKTNNTTVASTVTHSTTHTKLLFLFASRTTYYSVLPMVSILLYPMTYWIKIHSSIPQRDVSRHSPCGEQNFVTKTHGLVMGDGVKVRDLKLKKVNFNILTGKREQDTAKEI